MMPVKFVGLWCLVVSACVSSDAQNVTENEIRPYEFTFNIVDFQHRSEKRDDDGLITGEYGFITADGIYHETAYKTDKTGDFIITKMRHRKISSLKDAEEIFKDRPEQARMLAEALMKSCADCDISELDRQETSSFVRAATTTTTTTTTTSTTPEPKKIEYRREKKLDMAVKEMMKILHEKSNGVQIIYAEKYYQRPTESSSQVKRLEKEPDLVINSTTNEIIRDMVDAAKRVLEISSGENEREEITSDEILENMANDLFYRFNYTITSHGHWEDGFRDGRKDGEYNAKFKEGVDTHVKYVSNEFGFQPNITLVARVEEPVIEENESNVGIVYANDENSRDDKNYTEVDRSPRIIYRERPTTTAKPYKGHYFSWFRK